MFCSLKSCYLSWSFCLVSHWSFRTIPSPPTRLGCVNLHWLHSVCGWDESFHFSPTVQAAASPMCCSQLAVVFTQTMTFCLMKQISILLVEVTDGSRTCIFFTATDLINNLLQVKMRKRYSVDKCLSHPWLQVKHAPLLFSSQCLSWSLTFVQAHISFMQKKTKKHLE